MYLNCFQEKLKWYSKYKWIGLTYKGYANTILLNRWMITQKVEKSLKGDNLKTEAFLLVKFDNGRNRLTFTLSSFTQPDPGITARLLNKM